MQPGDASGLPPPPVALGLSASTVDGGSPTSRRRAQATAKRKVGHQNKVKGYLDTLKIELNPEEQRLFMRECDRAFVDTIGNEESAMKDRQLRWSKQRMRRQAQLKEEETGQGRSALEKVKSAQKKVPSLPPPAAANATANVSTRILGRRTAPLPPFLIPHRVPRGFTPRS